jgi:hypothetical protein
MAIKLQCDERSINALSCPKRQSIDGKQDITTEEKKEQQEWSPNDLKVIRKGSPSLSTTLRKNSFSGIT